MPGRTPHAHVPVPSLYTLLPTKPTSYRTYASKRQLDPATVHLADALNTTPCTPVLRSLLSTSIVKQNRARYEKRRYSRALSSSAADGLTARDGDAERTDNEAARPRSRRGKSGRAGGKFLAEAAEEHIAPLLVPEVVVPPFFPSGDLLQAIHTRASATYSAQHLLLPTLSASRPFLPDATLDLIDTLETKYEKAEEAQVVRKEKKRKTGRFPKQRKTVTSFDEWKTTWTSRNEGKRTGVWVDVERAYDSSALVAIAMLLDILAASELGDPAFQPASVQESLYPAFKAFPDSDRFGLPEEEADEHERDSGDDPGAPRKRRRARSLSAQSILGRDKEVYTRPGRYQSALLEEGVFPLPRPHHP